MVTLDGFIYSNDWDTNEWNKYDQCTGALVGTVTLCSGADENWGLTYDPISGNFLATSGFRDNQPSLLVAINVQTADLPTVSVSADQNYTCPIPSTFAPISVTTTADNIQWQVSTTSCTAGFSDISGATSASYTPSGLTSTTY